MKESILTRRALVKSGLMATVLVPALGLIRSPSASAADVLPLEPSDPQAAGLGFVNDASKVNGAANPTFASGQSCANCQQYQGKAGEARGGCLIFPAKSVPATGWCKVWSKKT